MTPENRFSLLRMLEELATKYPNWRFGQLVSNVAGWADVELWDIEDEQLMNACKLHLDESRSRTGETVVT